MNKKFLSAILFGALMVTSTGTFVSCKDYDDDIDELWEQINAQKSDLSTQVSTLQSALNSANSDIAAAKSEAAAAASKADKAGEEAALAKQAAAEAKAAAIEEAIKQAKELIAAVEAKAVSKEDYDAKVKEIEGKVTSLETQLAAVEKYKELIEKKADKSTVDALNAAIADLQAAIGKTATSAGMEELAAKIAAIQAELVTLKTTQLRSLVYVPSLYLDGVEADRYAYADGEYIAAVTTKEVSGTTDGGAAYLIKKGAKVEFSTVAKNAQYYLSSIDSVYYHLNPTHADLKDVVWSFNGTDAEFVSRAANWAPQFVGKAVNDGVLSVAYSIKNPNKLISTQEDSLSIMSLNAELANDSTVNSDYSAILPAVRVLKAIGLTDKNLEAVDCAKLADELYATAKDAAEAKATISVQYNKGAVNLDNYFNVHYIQDDFEKPTTGDHQAMTYTEALNNWGLKLTYELLPYTVGENKTSENAYGQIDGNKFYPCYVDSEGKSYKCDANGGTTGISAVGKTPIVIVTLVDTNNNNAVVLSGYVKLQIAKEIKNEKVDLKPAFEVPYVCAPEPVSITWAQASDQIYEATKISKEVFTQSYTIEQGTTYLYVKGEFKLATDKNGNYIYGMVTDGADQTGATNNIVTWDAYTDAELAAINKDFNGEVTLYAKYKSNTDIDNCYYIGITIKVLPKPEVTLGEKIEKYWFPTTKTVAERDSVRASVPVPDAANNVTTYVKDMDDYFMGNAVKPFATSATQNSAYFDKKTGFTQQFNYNYQFAVAQPKVGDYQLYLEVTATDKNKVATAWDVENLYADNTTTAKVTEKDLIATINTTTGEVTYNSGDVAKTVLNLFGHNDPKSAAANIEIVSTYGTCDIPLTNDDFTVRFQRPVDIVKGATAKFEDAQANGSSVVLGDLLGLKDWREVALIAIDSKTKKYISNKENGFDLYPYYDFKTLKIDIDNAQCDLNGKKQKVSEVTNKLQLTVDGNNPVDISNVDALNTTKITYKNNEGNVQNFNLWIPVEITYSWGTLKGEIEAVVKSTKASAN